MLRKPLLALGALVVLWLVACAVFFLWPHTDSPKHADAIGYADGLGDEAIPIGPACHLCERPDCPERALPPVTRALDLNQYRRPAAPYPFRAT